MHFSCREKKDAEVTQLEDSKGVEASVLKAIEDENEMLREKVKNLKAFYLKAVDFAEKNKIKLKERNVPISINSDVA